MSLSRFAKKRDEPEKRIMGGLRSMGVMVWQLDRPCDLLTFWGGRWLPMEVKAEGGVLSKGQAEFVALTGCPVVHNFEEARAALDVGRVRGLVELSRSRC